MNSDYLVEKVRKTIKENNLIKEKDKIVVGVSGGPDSMCLLHVLIMLKNELKFDLVVAHINHMIRKEADSETEFVKDFCKKNAIECFVKRVDVLNKAIEEKLGTEEEGRIIRYEFFEEVRKNTKSNKIATAHNANDNAETVLMNLIRGTGTSGLKGIEYERDYIIRPLLDCERVDIEKYCKIEKLDPKFDKSNKENTYTRNKIRNLLIPYIQKEFNPNIIESLNRLSDISKKEADYWKKTIENEYNKLVDSDFSNDEKICLNLKEFNKLDDVIKSKIILYTIDKVLGSTQGIGKIHIEDIIKLCNNNRGNKFLIPNKKIKVLVQDKKVQFMKNCTTVTNFV